MSNHPAPVLGEFDGQPVVRTTIAVTNAGDGLSQAMKVDPRLLHLGETVYVVLECEVAKVTFVPDDPKAEDDDRLARVHVLRAGAATIVDGEIVKDQVDAMTARIVLAREAEAGIQRLELDPDPLGVGVSDDEDAVVIPGFLDPFGARDPEDGVA